MTLQLILNNNSNITRYMESASFSGDSNKYNTQLDLNLQFSEDGRVRKLYVNVGDKISFSVDGVNQFVGIVFSTQLGSSGKMTATCYDTNIYLVKSTDTRIFINKKASDILRIIATDFGVPLGTIADTGYVIPYLKLSEKSLFEMVNTAITLTFKQTGKRYFVGNSIGKITLTQGATNPNKFFFRDDNNLINATYKRSIEDLATQVKVIGGTKGKETVITAKNDANRAKYGVLQVTEALDEKATASQVKQRADTLLKEKSEISEQLSVEVLEVKEIRVGTPVYISSTITETASGYYVTNFSKSYGSDVRTMTLELSKTLELPEVSIDENATVKELAPAKTPTTSTTASTNSAPKSSTTASTSTKKVSSTVKNAPKIAESKKTASTNLAKSTVNLNNVSQAIGGNKVSTLKKNNVAPKVNGFSTSNKISSLLGGGR